MKKAKVFIGVAAKTKLKDLPTNMIAELKETFHPTSTFNKWSYCCWVPYSARDGILDELFELL